MSKIDVFIDESGIGRKVGYSVYCLTYCFPSFKKEIDRLILEIEEKLKITTFHWREQSWIIKKKFLHQILKIIEWGCILCIVENKTHLFETPEQIIVKGLLGTSLDTIYIDGKKTKKYTHAVKKSLKNLGLNISSLKLVSSSACGGLRISDAVAGLVRLSLEKNLTDDVGELLKQVNKKISAKIISGYLPNPPHGR